jgi:hypothetical protein
MNSLLFIAYCFFFTWFTLAQVSPIAGHVERIHQIIPKESQRENTVKFLKDPKVWENLKDALVKDLAGLEKIGRALNEIIYELLPPDRDDPKYVALGRSLKLLKEYLNTLGTNKKSFSIEKAIGLFADLLEDYVKAPKLPRANYPDKKELGDVAEPLSLTLKKLNPKIWDKEFYGKLLKAADNQKYNDDDDNNNNGNWKEYLPHIFLAVGIALIVAGVVVFVILRRKGQIKALNF